MAVIYSQNDYKTLTAFVVISSDSQHYLPNQIIREAFKNASACYSKTETEFLTPVFVNTGLAVRIGTEDWELRLRCKDIQKGHTHNVIVTCMSISLRGKVS